MSSPRSRLERIGTLTLAVLVVSSVVSPAAVGLATAQDNIYTKTVTGSPDYVTIGTGNVDGQVEISITVSGSEIPGRNADATILRTVRGNAAVLQPLFFKNLGAYESLDVRVELLDGATGTPSIGTGSDYQLGTDGTLGGTPIGYTHGDADLECGIVESLNSVVGYSTDCNPLPPQGINTTNLDNEETKAALNAQATSTEALSESVNQTWDNYRDGYENEAIITGKNAYIRSLTAGDSKAVAEQRALNAVEDYWAVHQENLIERFNASASEVEYLYQKSQSQGLSETFVAPREGTWAGNHENYVNKSVYLTSRELTLTNGNTTSAGELVYYGEDGSSGSQYYVRMNPSGGWDRFRELDPYPNGQFGDNIEGPVVVGTPSSGGEPAEVLAYGDYAPVWSQIETSSSETKAELQTFIDDTYSSYQEGEISESDLVDPYLARQRLGPEDGDYQTWALATLSRLGVSTPETLENTGRMVVVDETTNTTYEGILLSDGLPSSGGFDAGTTYNATALEGGQYVVTSGSGTVELTGAFTPQSFEAVDGTNQDSVTYKNVTYETENLTEYRNLMQELSTLQAEIDARQEAAGVGGGGGTGDGVDRRGLLGQLVGGVALSLGVSRDVATALVAGTGLVALLLVANALNG